MNINTRIRLVLGCYSLVKTVNESLRYAYHMNMQQFKILLFIKDYSTAHERPLTIQTLVIKEHCNKAMMLKYLAQLYAMHWISKKRNPNDQRRLIIYMTKIQHKKIEHLLQEIKKIIANYDIDAKLDLHCHFKLKEFMDVKVLHDDFELTSLHDSIHLDELFILGLIYLYPNAYNMSQLKYVIEQHNMYITPLIKSLVDKKYIYKERCRTDERQIRIGIKTDKMSQVKLLFNECYNTIVNHLELTHI